MNIELVKQLRSETQASMQECRKAIMEAGEDLSKAIDLIKKKNLQNTAVNSSKIAGEGLIAFYHLDDNKTGMVEVNCATDFTAKSQEFGELMTVIVDGFEQNKPNLIDDAVKNLASITKEPIKVGQNHLFAADNNEIIVSYLHLNSKIGVLVKFEKQGEINQQFAEDVAMQIAAMKPMTLNFQGLDPVLMERQKSIFAAQVKELNKPEVASQKILDGKMNKWFSEVCLENQEALQYDNTILFNIKHPTIEMLANHYKMSIKDFVRFEVGELVEKKEENFAEAVQKTIDQTN